MATAGSTESGINRPHDKVALVLQGGGALGAYQAGVYEELADSPYQPDWIAGVSIGAINAAIIAGNPRERRVARANLLKREQLKKNPFDPVAVRRRRIRMSKVSTAACGKSV